MADEIQAMSAINEAMQSLKPDETKRILRWAVDKFGRGEVQVDPIKLGRDKGDHSGDDGKPATGQYERISDLMDAASPNTVVDHVLVASYWFQVLKGQESFTGQEVNSELKDLGHGSKNITDTYNSLITRKPPAARQIQKSGTTRQARKRYRLTEVGVRAVEKMLRGDKDD